MSVQLQAVGGDLIGRTLATAGTAWYAVVPGSPGLVTRLISAQIDNGATDNGLYLMRPLASSIVQQAQAAADTTIILTSDPSPSGNTIASGDQVVLLFADGTYRRVTVSSWSASTLTLTVGSLPAAISAGTTLWNLGIFSDTEPVTSLPFPLLDTPVSVVKDYPLSVGFAGTAGQPLMLYCPNATNQTKLNNAEYARTSA